jgi:hypothetical protein
MVANSYFKEEVTNVNPELLSCRGRGWKTHPHSTGVPGQWVVVDGVKGGKEARTLSEIHKNGSKNGRFPAFIDYTISENTVFLLKSSL